MDRAVLINELKYIFAEINANYVRYPKVWLSEENYGGLYRSGKYILNAIAEHSIKSYTPEIRYLIDLLSDKLGKDQWSYISEVSVFLENEDPFSNKEDILLYDNGLSNKAA
jgi:hypothetical protein